MLPSRLLPARAALLAALLAPCAAPGEKAAHAPSPSPAAVTAPQPHATIAEFAPAAGRVAPGGRAVSSLRVRNEGPAAATFWVGYSVQDAAGAWHDVPSTAVAVDAGALSPPVRRAWSVPPAGAPGPFRVVMAVWDSPPETGTAARLASADRRDAFDLVPSTHAIQSHGWTAGAHRLGRGRLDPSHVIHQGTTARLVLPAGTYDGAQIATPERYATGSFRASMRTARAPGSLSAFFLYEDVPGDANDEVDVEVFNDGGGRALLSLWRDGELTRSSEVELGFDPGAAAHEYRIDLHGGSADFYVDGRLLRRWTEGVPDRPMKLMANAWWPTWLEGPPPAADVFTEVAAIRVSPLP
jgi:hypothetical protein